MNFAREESVGRGMSSFLKLIRDRNRIGNEALEYTGRNKDKLMHKELAKHGGKRTGEPKLEYRDANGKLMTQKEAFRYQCWTFHNQKPSLKKQERAALKEQIA